MHSVFDSHDPRAAGRDFVRLEVNGTACRVEVQQGQLLAELLRDVLDLKACHLGCLTGDCGACTVLLDGAPAKACLSLGVAMEGRCVTTLEGADTPLMRRLQAAFIARNAFQCGFCTAGMLLIAADLLHRVAAPDEAAIRWAINGNLCRCTAYEPIVQAIQDAAASQRDKPE